MTDLLLALQFGLIAVMILSIIYRVNIMSQLGQELIDRVTKIENAGDAIIAILQATRADLAAAIANASLPEAQEVLDRLTAQTDELAAAAVANTDAAPDA